MSIPDLELTVRLVGLPLVELWGRYLAVGGSSRLSELGDRINGTVEWTPREDLFLAVALNDSLLDESLGLDPVDGLLGDPYPDAGSPLLPTSAGVLAGRGGSSGYHAITDMSALIERSRETRRSARLLRATAEEVRLRAAASTTDGHLRCARLIRSLRAFQTP